MGNSNSGCTEAKALEREQAGSSGNTQRSSLQARGLERAVSRELASQAGRGEGVGVW